MPQDLICRDCDYTVSIGWYHYADAANGYGARTAFACAQCGVTHYVEHAVVDSNPDRYLYHARRSSLWKERNASMPPGDVEKSDDRFEGFESFSCPACGGKGRVITAETLKSGPPPCCLCGKRMEELAFWVA